MTLTSETLDTLETLRIRVVAAQDTPAIPKVDRRRELAQFRAHAERQVRLGLGDLSLRVTELEQEIDAEEYAAILSEEYPRVDVSQIEEVETVQVWDSPAPIGVRSGMGFNAANAVVRPPTFHTNTPTVIRVSPNSGTSVVGYQTNGPNAPWRHYAADIPAVPTEILDRAEKVQEATKRTAVFQIVWAPTWRETPAPVLQGDPALVATVGKDTFLLGTWGGDVEVIEEWMLKK